MIVIRVTLLHCTYKIGVLAGATHHSRDFQKIFGLLEEACHELDMKLASCHHSSEHHGSFTPYTVALLDLNKTKADLDVAQQSANILEQNYGVLICYPRQGEPPCTRTAETV